MEAKNESVARLKRSKHENGWNAFYDVVQQVPSGRVTTYGAVARLAGRPGHARQVGYALAALDEESTVPWHRVVNAHGRISARRSGIAFERIQHALLVAEGVEIDDHGCVDLDQFGWP